MPLPDNLTPFINLPHDCTKLILDKLSTFDQTNLAVTSRHFNRAFTTYKNDIQKQSREDWFYAHLKALFGNKFTLTIEDVKKLLNLSNDEFNKLCDYSEQTNENLVAWCTSDEIMANNSLFFWHLVIIEITQSYHLYELANQVSVTVENLKNIKYVVKHVHEIRRILQADPLQADPLHANPVTALTLIRRLDDLGHETNTGWIKGIVEELFIHIIQVYGKITNKGPNDYRIQLLHTLVFTEEKQFCIKMLKAIQEKFNTDFFIYHQSINYIQETSFVENWLNYKLRLKLPNNFATMLAEVDKIQCLDILRSFNVDDPAFLMKIAEIIILLKQIGIEKEMIVLLMQRYGKHSHPGLPLQIKQLKNLIDGFSFAPHPHHVSVLFLHLFKAYDFEKYKEKYKRYIESTHQLESYVNLNEKILTLLSDIFFQFRLTDEEMYEFLEMIVQKSFAIIDYWDALFRENWSEFFGVNIENKLKLTIYIACMLDGNTNNLIHDNYAAIRAILFLFKSEYDRSPPSKLRFLLEIKQDNKLWLNDESNQSWFDSTRLGGFSGNPFTGYGDARNQLNFLSKFGYGLYVPTRLNQLAALDNVLNMRKIISEFRGRSSEVALVSRDVLLGLPDRIYEVTLRKLKRFSKEMASKDVKQLSKYDYYDDNFIDRLITIYKEELSFLTPFINSSCSDFSALNPFFNQLSEALFKDMITHAGHALLSSVIRTYDYFYKHTPGMRDLYLRFINLVFEISNPQAFPKYEEFLTLATEESWFKDATAQALALTQKYWDPTILEPKYIRIELTRLMDELLALKLTTAEKRKCEEEDINPRPTKRSNI